ncbi:helix-turn-helix domain-containing protein [Clostridiaceae bacterium DONG20-135]|uniref:Helix-turn-helix domain-containing protein n=1 Tax=Copranaerobaculum intestinale TaxID=2692629 RepID=A0A6N8U8R1_9FIRM|nr:helix-turn-helix transcriptional regulator [Copranaerobaculum intestinale]MXQ73103.1 helix-turn-helix domain-containing protein [Copranaerobaculum intestinale]
MKFEENLRELRKQNGLSQEELAEKLNVSRQAVSKWENGVSQTKGY